MNGRHEANVIHTQKMGGDLEEENKKKPERKCFVLFPFLRINEESNFENSHTLTNYSSNFFVPNLISRLLFVFIISRLFVSFNHFYRFFCPF